MVSEDATDSVVHQGVAEHERIMRRHVVAEGNRDHPGRLRLRFEETDDVVFRIQLVGAGRKGPVVSLHTPEVQRDYGDKHPTGHRCLERATGYGEHPSTIGKFEPLGLLSALLLNRKFRGRSMARSAIAVPWAFPEISAVLVFIGFNTLEASQPSMASRIAPGNARGAALGVYNS